MRVLVTGGTGHSGSHIIPELIAAGHDVGWEPLEPSLFDGLDNGHYFPVR